MLELTFLTDGVIDMKTVLKEIGKAIYHVAAVLAYSIVIGFGLATGGLSALMWYVG